jgi:hypothetical protein
MIRKKEAGDVEDDGDVGRRFDPRTLCAGGLISSAEAVIKIETAQVQNGVAFIQGNSAALGAQITWEGGAVTTANTKNGGFSFFGVLPANC